MKRNKINNTKEVFETEAKMFDHIKAMYFESKGFVGYWQNRRREKVLDTLKNLRKDCFSLLDVGCAEGYFVEEALKMGYIAKGLEISEGKRAKCIAKGLDVVDGDAENLLFGDNSYDIVMLNRVLELVPDDLKALDEATRVAKKYLIITVPKGKGRDEIYKYSWGLKRRSYTYSELKIILKKYGRILELAGLCPLGFLPYLIGQIFRSLKLYKIAPARVLDKVLEDIYQGGHDIFLLIQVRKGSS